MFLVRLLLLRFYSVPMNPPQCEAFECQPAPFPGFLCVNLNHQT
jgi:hypothetical protein